MAPAGLAIILGAGPTTGAGIARILSSPSYGNLAVALLSRSGDQNLADTISKSCQGGEGALKAFKSDTSEQALTQAFEAVRSWKAELDSRHGVDLPLKLSVYNIKHSHKSAFEEETATRFTDSMTVYVTGAMVFSQLSVKWMLAQNSSPSTAATTSSTSTAAPATSTSTSTSTENNNKTENPSSNESPSTPPLSKKGTIIFTSTLGSLRTNAGYAAYGATRASVRMLAQSLAREYSARGVHVVHAIANGGITDKKEGEDVAKIARGERIKAESVGKLYLGLADQDVDLWVHELDMRPAAEKF